MKNVIKHNGEELRIVVLQRGWVIMGDYYQDGSNCWIENGFVVRRWGTSQCIGELAIKGKLPDTILDPLPKTSFHELSIIMSILCDRSKWCK